MATKMTKMPKRPVIHSPFEWDAYQTQMIQYQKEQLARQKAKIAALERKVKRLQEQSDTLRALGGGKGLGMVP